MNNRMSGKSTRMLSQIMLWITEKKSFAAFGADYVVLGMDSKVYDKHFAHKAHVVRDRVSVFDEELKDIPESFFKSIRQTPLSD